MIKVCSISAIRQLPEGPAKKAMLANVEHCIVCEEGMQVQMEEDFNNLLGGYWYLFEEGDDPRAFPISEDQVIDLLSEEWRWCEVATLEDGCFMVFWATNNAGGPCLFIEDVPSVPLELREWLEALVSD